MNGRMDGADLEEVIDTLRSQTVTLEARYGQSAASNIAAWEANRPELLISIQALTQTRELMRKVGLDSLACPLMIHTISYPNILLNNRKRAYEGNTHQCE